MKTKKKMNSSTSLNPDAGAIVFIIGVSILLIMAANTVASGPVILLSTNLVPAVAAALMLIVGAVIASKNRGTYQYEPATKADERLRSSLETAMTAAWADHHHARDQTWKALQMEALLAVALIGIDLKVAGETFVYLPMVGGTILFFIAISGIMITLHHRELERRKFRHIMHCEDALGVRAYIDGVNLPAPIYIWDIFAFWKSNTVLFIMRMHFAILVLALWFLMSRP